MASGDNRSSAWRPHAATDRVSAVQMNSLGQESISPAHWSTPVESPYFDFDASPNGAPKRQKEDTAPGESPVFVSYLTIAVGATLMVFSLIYVMVLQIAQSEDTRLADDIFAFFVQFVMFGWCFGVNLSMWSWKHVDFVRALELRPPVLTRSQAFTLVSHPTIVLGSFLLVFLILQKLGLIFSAVMWLCGVAYLVAPAPAPFQGARWAFLRITWDSVLASFGCVEVRFVHTFYMDGLTSACLLLYEMSYTWCCFVQDDWWSRSLQNRAAHDCSEYCGSDTTTGRVLKPAMYCIPFFLRLLQEIRQRHWLNALKYVSCLFLVGSAAVHSFHEQDGFVWDYTRAIWLAAVVIKTAYCYIWDIRRDWGLWQTWGTSTAPVGLREASTLSFPPQVYYTAMVTNLLARASWAFAISPDLLGNRWHVLLALVEISRRAQWNYFRVENRLLQLDASQMRTTLVNSESKSESKAVRVPEPQSPLQSDDETERDSLVPL
eukprot:TRINITY_DN9917_c0_g1_i1.p1 TRINITY_DN9917_c0_g1~~TRINITY_DN9917_c0_g1_i1.p1  ORF type:complete len:490 (-),score=75.41 TRINITY_DN9917_c0_g1_i1:282-1751(-)